MPRKGLPWARRSGPLQVERGIMLSTKTTTRASNPGPWPSSCSTHTLMQRAEHLVLRLGMAVAIPYLSSQLLILPPPTPLTPGSRHPDLSWPISSPSSSSWVTPTPTANFLQTPSSQTSHTLAHVVPSCGSDQCHISPDSFSPSEHRVLSQSSSFRDSEPTEH